MRSTYDDLIKDTLDLMGTDVSSTPNLLSDPTTFAGRAVNKTVQNTENLLRNHEVFDEYTITTVEDQESYNLPLDIDVLEAAKYVDGTVEYDLEVIDSLTVWTKLTGVDYANNAYPQICRLTNKKIFPYPKTPADSKTITLYYSRVSRWMTLTDDYEDETIDVTNDDATVTGNSTSFDADTHTGAWILIRGQWYQIASVTSTTELELDRVYEGTTESSISYRIGQSPALPMSLHQFLPYRAAAEWYAGPRRDTKHAQRLLNYYFTGDYENTSRDPADNTIKGGVLYFINEYDSKGSNNSPIVKRRQHTFSRFDERQNTIVANP